MFPGGTVHTTKQQGTIKFSTAKATRLAVIAPGDEKPGQLTNLEKLGAQLNQQWWSPEPSALEKFRGFEATDTLGMAWAAQLHKFAKQDVKFQTLKLNLLRMRLHCAFRSFLQKIERVRK